MTIYQNIVYLNEDPVQQAINLANAINSALDGTNTQDSINNIVSATSSGNVVTITSAESQFDTTDAKNAITMYVYTVTDPSIPPFTLSPSDGSLGGGTPYIPYNVGETVPVGTVFTVGADPYKYVITSSCTGGHLQFTPASRMEWPQGATVTLGITITESANALFTVTEECLGAELKFTPALDTIWLEGTYFVWSTTKVAYDMSRYGKLYFLPQSNIEWPVGTVLTFGVPITTTVPTTCDRRLETCISYGNEKRYCGFPTTGGRSIVV